MSGMRKETKERYTEIYQMYLDGKGRDEICEEANCSYSTIDRVMRQYGATFRHGSFADNKDKILGMYKDGRTYRDIAEETGLDETTICRNLRCILSEEDRAEHKGGKVHKKRKEETFRAEAEQEEEYPWPKQYAKDTRRARHIEIRGKWYIDITDWFM